MPFNAHYRKTMHSRERDRVHYKELKYGAVKVSKRGTYKFVSEDLKDVGVLEQYLVQAEQAFLLEQRNKKKQEKEKGV